MSDSAPLLKDQQQNGIDLSKLKPELPAVDGASGKNPMGGYDRDANLKHANSQVEDDQSNDFNNDGPGAVIVNLLTSLRHLPPAMHSVLIVMALSWVSSAMIIIL